MKPKTQIVFTVRGRLGDHNELVCISREQLCDCFKNWLARRRVNDMSMLTIACERMTKKQIDNLSKP
jgi:hypothetical protein